MTRPSELDIRESMSDRTHVATLVAFAVLTTGTFALVTLVALPLTALLVGEASAWSVAAGALAAAVVAGVLFARYRYSKHNPARLRFHDRGLVRSIDGHSFSLRWDEVAWVGLVHKAIAGDMVVIEPAPPSTLTPDNRRGARQQRQNRVVHGGEVVFPLTVTGLSAAELDERVAELSDGAHRVERRQPPHQQQKPASS